MLYGKLCFKLNFSVVSNFSVCKYFNVNIKIYILDHARKSTGISSFYLVSALILHRKSAEYYTFSLFQVIDRDEMTVFAAEMVWL